MSFIPSIRTALWSTGDEIRLTEQEVALHMRQGTATLVFPYATPMTTQMKAVCVQNMQQQVKLQHTLELAWSALTNAGIRPVLMKGAGLAALYPEPQMRSWGDIDLFVGKEQYHAACAVMRDTFPKALKFDEELDHYKHYNLIVDGISIEIHRVTVSLSHPLDARRYARMEAYGMSHAIPLTLSSLHPFTVTIPEPTFNALFVFLHAWEHMLTQGANIRQLCDLALLLHHYADELDRKRLVRWLKALRLYDVWCVVMSIVVETLGLSPQEAPGYNEARSDRADRLLNDLLEGRLVAPKTEHQSSTSENRFVRKWHTMQERLANAKRIEKYSPAYARHMAVAILLSGSARLFAKDRHWE